MTQYIDLHYNEDLSIDNIAQHFNISTGYLSHYFKSHLNVTVKEYLIAVRLKGKTGCFVFKLYNFRNCLFTWLSKFKIIY